MGEIASVALARRVVAAARSDRGRVRAGNEDRHYVDVERGIFLVVDGVGGHAAGEVAAEIAVDVIVQRLERPIWSVRQRVREAIALANNEIFKQSAASPAHAGMTCVLTLALLTDRTVTIGHVGDSRLYMLTSDGMQKVTHDHSPIGEREDAHEISEIEAMRHPRRNEVFRDVGSTFHDPDDPGFIDVIEVPFESDSALLICSDGLSDRLPSTLVDQLVREHAGHPEAVVDSLIVAANDAGGQDNITVVYVEGLDFAEASNARPRRPESAAELPAIRVPAQSSRPRRTTWLAGGLLLGLLTGVGLSVVPAVDSRLNGPQAQTLIVDRTAPGQFPSINTALASAASGDVVQIEPGEYAESVVLKDGIDLIARMPGTVLLIAPPDQPAWVSLAATGQLGNKIAGIRVVGRPGAAITVGMHLGGHDLVVDDVTIEGVVGIGMDIVHDGEILIRSSRFSELTGVPIRIAKTARPVIRQNLFVSATPRAPQRAIDIADGASPSLTANLFVGYADVFSQKPSPATPRVTDNYVIEAPNYVR